MTETELLEIAALGEGYSTHPIANSIRESYGKTPDMKRTENANEIVGHGISITVDNKAVLIGNEKLMKRKVSLTPLARAVEPLSMWHVTENLPELW